MALQTHEEIALVSSGRRKFSSMLLRLGDTHVLVAQLLDAELRVAACKCSIEAQRVS